MSQTMLRQYLIENAPDRDLAFLVESIAMACTSIAADVRAGALRGNQGLADSTNVQGEDQKPLDIISNDRFFDICGKCPGVAALVSEEVDDAVWLKEPEAGDFLLYFDPLDGSSNLDVNVTVGSIFSIMRVAKDGDRTLLKPGTEQICAGYAAYGPSTLLVLSFGEGVDGFSLEAESGQFCLSAPQMRIPPETSEYAINTARARHWDAPIAAYVADLQAGSEGPRGRDFNMRWVGSMVADVHRILTRGGVFIYPVDAKTRAKGGRLRLMYEANPMGFLVEAAGGAASHGTGRICEIAPNDLHQRVPVMLGSAVEIAEIEDYFREKS